MAGKKKKSQGYMYIARGVDVYLAGNKKTTFRKANVGLCSTTCCKAVILKVGSGDRWGSVTYGQGVRKIMKKTPTSFII